MIRFPPKQLTGRSKPGRIERVRVLSNCPLQPQPTPCVLPPLPCCRWATSRGRAVRRFSRRQTQGLFLQSVCRRCRPFLSRPCPAWPAMSEVGFLSVMNATVMQRFKLDVIIGSLSNIGTQGLDQKTAETVWGLCWGNDWQGQKQHNAVAHAAQASMRWILLRPVGALWKHRRLVFLCQAFG